MLFARIPLVLLLIASIAAPVSAAGLGTGALSPARPYSAAEVQRLLDRTFGSWNVKPPGYAQTAVEIANVQNLTAQQQLIDQFRRDSIAHDQLRFAYEREHYYNGPVRPTDAEFQRSVAASAQPPDGVPPLSAGQIELQLKASGVRSPDPSMVETLARVPNALQQRRWLQAYTHRLSTTDPTANALSKVQAFESQPTAYQSGVTQNQLRYPAPSAPAAPAGTGAAELPAPERVWLRGGLAATGTMVGIGLAISATGSIVDQVLRTGSVSASATARDLTSRPVLGGLTGSVALGLVGGILGRAASSLPGGQLLSVLLPVAGSMLGGQLGAGQKVDWARLALNAGITSLVAMALPATLSGLTAMAVLMGTGIAADTLYAWLKHQHAPAPAEARAPQLASADNVQGAVSLLGVRAQHLAAQ